ncbi:MAG: transglycosylase SLT domain-containing protein [Chitinivibrionales bacterium]|nr:transglycosylase SLT domain-containing protein [Chitinivibrionales bacterium]MBD3395486.1 transglycosylase SLT domain-containing protein [Chitinivibrionales bacterium]
MISMPTRYIHVSRLLRLFQPVLCLASVCLGDPFETPAILKDNVEFWKKIYAEVSLEEGLIHDAEHPMVIYEKISIGSRAGRRRALFIKAHKEKIGALVQGIPGKAPASLLTEEKRIVALFQKHASEDAITGAHARIRFQQGQKERFYEGLYRSGAYLDTILAILRMYDVPPDLAYLPHVESSFNPHAYSKVGAAGLWQFMRGTGRQYLKIGYDVDERRDPIASTYAAAKLLSHNYRELKSWPLAITAYNHGLYGMKRAVATTGSRDIAVIIQRHSSRSFKFASKNFYSCFLAACDIARQPEKYFTKVEYAPPTTYHDMVLTHYIRPSVLAKHLGADVRALARMNPAVRPVVFQRDRLIPKGTRIHLPASISLAFADSAFRAIPDSLRLETPPRPEYYRVRRGDNLYAIARRFGVRARDLALDNNISRMNRIYAGQVLRIPGVADKKPAPIVSFVEDKRAESHLAAPQPAGGGEGKEDTAVVAAASAARDTTLEMLSDTLEEIVMAEAVAAPDVLKGRYQSRFDAEVYDLEVEISPVGKSASIRVSVDETLGHYADWLGLPTWRLRQLNRMGNRSTIHIGQRLTIPGDTMMIARFVEERLEYHMALEEDFYSQYKVAEVRRHAVERGQTLLGICEDDGTVPLWLVKKYNKHTDLSRLDVGMILWIPVVAEKTEEDFEFEKRGPGSDYRYYREPIQPPSKPLQRVP